MRVLFDHNLPHKLRTSLTTLCAHEIVSASYMGWGDLKNSELLRAAEENGFQVFVTGDQTLVYEQNLTGRRLAIVALSANNRYGRANEADHVRAQPDLPHSIGVSERDIERTGCKNKFAISRNQPQFCDGLLDGHEIDDWRLE